MSGEWRDRATLLRADFRETLACCQDMGGGDLVLTSPPFADARGYGADVSWTLEDYAALGDAIFAALKPGGWALVNLDAPVREWRAGFGTERGFQPLRVFLDWTDRVGFRSPDRLVFGRMGTPGEYRGRFRCDSEPLFWFQRPGGDGYFDKAVLAAPGTSGAYDGEVSHNAEREGKRVRRMTGVSAREGLRQRGTVWNYGVVGRGHTGCPALEDAGHPARWPLRLAEDIVWCFCPPDGLAVDPFLGAGTSAVAALDHGRRFLGGDALDRPAAPSRGLAAAPWVDVAAGILDARYVQQRLFQPGAPLER